jgi:hypothetical protein
MHFNMAVARNLWPHHNDLGHLQINFNSLLQEVKKPLRPTKRSRRPGFEIRKKKVTDDRSGGTGGKAWKFRGNIGAVSTGIWTGKHTEALPHEPNCYVMRCIMHDCHHLLRIRCCYVLLIQPTVEPWAGKVWLTNDPHFTFGLGAICSEFLPDQRILIPPPGGPFISKIKRHKTPGHYQITQNNSQWRVQNTLYQPMM